MRKILAVVMLGMLVVMAGCATKPENKEDNTVKSTVSERNLTQEEVVELCYEKYGERDEDTGFDLIFACEETIEKNGEVYHVVDFRWLVNNDHLSRVDTFAVAARNGEIYNIERDSAMNAIICDSRGETL